MRTSATKGLNIEIDVSEKNTRDESAKTQVALLTGGGDRPYAIGMAMALVSTDVLLDIIGSDEIESQQFYRSPNVKFLNLRGNVQSNASLTRKVIRLIAYYAQLLRYAATAKPKIFHILWNNKFEFFDRTLLTLYYKACGKKIVLTAHNVNAGKRDLNDSLLNRLTLRAQYRLSDHIFVHTESMKRELVGDFFIPQERVTVIPFGINNSVPDTDLTTTQARQRLGIRQDQKVVLFFGAIRPYKGLEYLLEAFRELAAGDPDYCLIVAGAPGHGSEQYLKRIRCAIERDPNQQRILQRLEYISDEDTEIYFKAADVLALPYTHVFQSGVLFLAYNFGLPVVATDVGSIKEDIVEGVTGFLTRPRDAADFRCGLEKYFKSNLFRTLSDQRQGIRKRVAARHSWDVVGGMTKRVYQELLPNTESCVS